MEKSYVTLETKMCPICGKEEDSGNLLLSKRLENIFDKHTCTGWGLCKECSELNKEYVTLVVCKNISCYGRKLKPEEADRTGEVIRVKRDTAKQIFNVTMDAPLAFIDLETAEKLKGIVVQH